MKALEGWPPSHPHCGICLHLHHNARTESSRGPPQKFPQCCSILGHLDIRLHLQHHLKQGQDKGHRSPAHNLSQSPHGRLPWQVLLISVLSDVTWVSKHVACSTSLVGIPDLRTQNARHGQGKVPADMLQWCRYCGVVASEGLGGPLEEFLHTC